MNTQTRNMLLESVIDVLERFTLVFADPQENTPLQKSSVYMHSTMTFSGPDQGVLAVSAPLPLCREMAANVLGIIDTEEVSTEQAGDALKELVNVVCGDFVTRLYGENALVDISVPSLHEIDNGKWQELSADDDTIILRAEDYPLLVSSTLEE